MAITSAQKAAMREVLQAILNFTQGGRYKRHLSDIFLDLPNKEDFEDYYRIIPHPRCLNDVKKKIDKDEYKECTDAYGDLNLVFLNALYYNEDGSQVHSDATRLKMILDTEWNNRSVLPTPRASLPPESAQRTHQKPEKRSKPPAPPPASAPAPTLPKAPATPVPAPAPTPAAAIQTPAPALTVQPPVAGPSTAPPASTHVASPQQARGSSPDQEGDGEAEDGEENLNGREEEARDGESESIIRQLEKGLPRWEGFGDQGWMDDVPNERLVEIVHAVKSYKDVVGNRYSEALDALPEETKIPDIPYSAQLSLRLIESKARAGSYPSSRAFDEEMSQLFLKARRTYEPTTEPYTRVLLLQRLYHQLTFPPPSAPISTPIPPSPSNFASIRAGGGPGAAEPATAFRVSTKDREIVEELWFKGMNFRLGDWVHVANPDDPGRPIVAQVFRCFVSEDPKSKGQPGISVCWYYRPEQTWHPAHRQFWQNEVFKTGHFADHTLPDIIEKIACQFTARHIRGRPRPPYWYPGEPLYVCDSRYNDRERVFVKIKNWNSCVPEEVRKSDGFMPIYPFERIVYPRRFASPFLQPPAPGSLGGGGQAPGPGGLGDPIERAEGEKIEGGGTGRKRSKKASASASATDTYGPSKGLYVGGPLPGQQPQLPVPAPMLQQVQVQQQRSHTPQVQQQQQQAAPRAGDDRSIVGAAGGWGVLGTNASASKLPPETAKLFDRDPETNEVLWFASPPVDVARVPPPRYSLAYLHHLAMKRKAVGAGSDSTDVDAGGDEVNKRARVGAPQRTTDAINALYADIFGDK
ncbi:hypothetical protein PUNSTDRAFT_78873 [Punctularia strigosozonata HHB-11173 SS5]|uniref:uncharacterized protein n=1 Tax=Punctularia strigosozonata (strain HHB-11173) TaxID=741275 RepID=UPI0004416764|nr:uncharacterized protein PUNSTDRAFT_78873 [Punctularia strigosozonata HHB-11173 SS5]EIN13357.1 hypothetical protein PUNSTDRAFT_78873 [Punctularia strigosozonata HHB-11173 SS5]